MAEALKQPTTLGIVGAVLWGVSALLGVLLVTFGLAMSDPIEPEDWLLSCVFLLLFVVVPSVLSAVAYRAVSFGRSGSLFAGALLTPLLLYWIVVYG